MPPAEGIPIAPFTSTPDQPGDLFYDDVAVDGAARPNWPEQTPDEAEEKQDLFEGRVTSGFSSKPHSPGGWFQKDMSSKVRPITKDGATAEEPKAQVEPPADEDTTEETK